MLGKALSVWRIRPHRNGREYGANELAVRRHQSESPEFLVVDHQGVGKPRQLYHVLKFAGTLASASDRTNGSPPALKKRIM